VFSRNALYKFTFYITLHYTCVMSLQMFALLIGGHEIIIEGECHQLCFYSINK